ncbi:hypothetical protein RF183_10355, partial [Escherichia coli]|uniref:hypothetical protein n=1 Tax=Escherichia coli TaxID=562 RepID=UPI002813FD9F
MLEKVGTLKLGNHRYCYQPKPGEILPVGTGVKKSDFSYNILIIDVLLCSGTDGAEKPARGEIATVNFLFP